MTQHIGIVACSAEGAALCYRTICAEGAALMGAHAHPEVSIHTPSLAKYVGCLERGDWPGVGELMLASANKLAARGIQCVRASAAECEQMQRIIMDELVNGVFKPHSLACIQSVIQRMRHAGCDAVILGCTEIALIVNDSNSALPTLDSTRLLARAALRRAVAALARVQVVRRVRYASHL